MCDDLEPFRQAEARGCPHFRTNRCGVVRYCVPVDKGRMIETGLPASDTGGKPWSAAAAAAINRNAGNEVLLFWLYIEQAACDAVMYRTVRSRTTYSDELWKTLKVAQDMIPRARAWIAKYGGQDA